MKRIGIVTFMALQLTAQNPVLRQGSSPSGDVDFSGANTTKPVRTGATLPGSCTASELFFLTNVGLHQCVKGKFAPLGNGGTWGTVGGAIAAQTDLWNALQNKQPVLNGTPSQYVRGDGSLGALAPSATIDTTNASNITQGTLPPAVLPNPTTSTAGGLYAAQATAHQWLSYVDASGQQHFSQPDAGDITTTSPGGVQRTQSDKNAETVSMKDFGGICDGNGNSGAGTDNAAAVLAAIAAVPAGGTVLFPSFGCGTYGYTVGPLGVIVKPVTLDFGGSSIYVKANAAPWMTVGYPGPNGHLQLKNGVLSPFTGYVPTDVLVIDGASNSEYEHVTFGYLKATHAIVWHKAAYGVVFHNCQFNSNDAPSTVYYSYRLSDSGNYYTLNATIDRSDFSGIATGRCIGIEGGSLSVVHSVVESCAGGGIEHIEDYAPWGMTMNLTNLNIEGGHFEHNELFNLKFPHAVAPNYFQSNVKVDSSVFMATGGAAMMNLGGITNAHLSGNWSDSGCITGDPTRVQGTLIAHNNEVQSISGTCDANTKGLIDTSISSLLARQGSFHSQLWSDYMGFSVLNPYVMQQLSSTAGSKIVSFVDNTNTEKAYVTREGNVFGNFFGSINGAAIPLSQPSVGTNASGQFVAGAGQILGAYCGGTITSNATVNLFGDVGHPASGSAACTNVTAGAAGVPLRAGTIKNLRVRDLIVSGTASSGVVTVWKNNIQQTMTCTLGTSTACSDLTHSFTIADGDFVGIRVQSTAASGDTLGNIFASVQLF